MAEDTPVADSGLDADRVYGRAQLVKWLEDVDLMKSHATSQGIALPARTIERICEVAKLRIALEPALAKGGVPSAGVADQVACLIRKVLELHAELSLLIAPATPRSLASTLHRPCKERILRPSFIAGLLTIAVFSIGGFVATVAFGAAEPSKIEEQLRWLAAALLGASFASLFTAYRYIVNRTFDPQYTAVYWVRIILGGVAGVVLANFGQNLAPESKLTPSVLALLGGYSAEAVNQLLTRFTEVLVSAVKGNNEAQLRDKERELTSAKSKAREELSRERDRTAEELAAIVGDAKRVQAPTELIERLNGALTRAQGAPVA